MVVTPRQFRSRASPPSGDAFRQWLGEVSPGWSWDWPHLAHVRLRLQAVTEGRCRRLMVFMPPQHGKSEQVTVRYPAFRIEQNPQLRVIVGSYSQRHANKFSRKTRKLLRKRVRLSAERKAAGEWDTEAGGGYLAAGVGVGITGNPGDLIIIDDPIKSREQADSEVYREKVDDWYKEEVYTRQSPNCAIVLIMTRWHEDDLAGRLLERERDRWEVVSLPADAEEGDPLGRTLNEPLCPERFNKAELDDRKRTLGSAYSALYRQRPVPRGGDLIKRDWFSPLVKAVPRVAQRVRYWDTAATEGGTGAATAGVLMAKTRDGLYWIEDVVRGRWSIHQRRQEQMETAKRDREQFGHVTTWEEREPGGSGKESAEITVRQFAGYSIKIDQVRTDKLTRALPFADQAEAKNVRVLQADWTEAYLSELTSFPRGKHRDQVDATSGGFNKLALGERCLTAEDISSGGSNIERGVLDRAFK